MARASWTTGNVRIVVTPHGQRKGRQAPVIGKMKNLGEPVSGFEENG